MRTVETGFILGVPKIMKISSFMDAHKCLEFAKRYFDKVSKTVDEMIVKLDDYVQSEKAFANTELLKREASNLSKKPRPMQTSPKKENQDKYYGHHGGKGHYTNDCFQLKMQLELALESGKLNHLVKDVRKRGRGGPKGKETAKDKVINMIPTWP
ncbi:hypothetical protein Tco_1275539 [Tanacetum coccineum]